MLVRQKIKKRTFQAMRKKKKKHEIYLHCLLFLSGLVLKNIILINYLAHVKSLRVISVNSKFGRLDFDINKNLVLIG